MEKKTKNKKRILIFTDSRGQHKPGGQTHDIFAERLAKDDRLDVDMYLCPMKWTTTLDFLEHFSSHKLAEYDHVILYTGIVEWSPRPASSAINDLYDNPSLLNADALALNTRDYSRKVVNNKKAIFDRIFGADAMATHFSTPFDVKYEGEKTNNMYSIVMAPQILAYVKRIPNLIFISANRFVRGWEGDFKRKRPENIYATHAYSDLFAEELKAAGVPLVDLRSWSDVEIKRFTCDNLHLSKDGSDWIYDELMAQMDLKPRGGTHTLDFAVPDYKFKGFKTLSRFAGNTRAKIMNSANCTDPYLATLIIGVRCNPGNSKRLENLRFLLKWLNHYYGDLFDVLLIEQDTESRISLKELSAEPYVRHEFIYNPSEYNRGWAYNVAVRHYCENAKVVALMDTDVLTGPNFVRDVMDCHGLIDVASPYLNIYYSDKKEADIIRESMALDHLKDDKKIKNPVTVAGGVVIWNRAAYMAIKGFEQYVGYGCEDRAMDVTIFNHIEKHRIRISPQTYVHLYHDTDAGERVRFKEIYGHLASEYKCSYDPKLGPFDFIHATCRHVTSEKTLKLMLERTRDFGDIELYRRGDKLAVNGVRLAIPEVHKNLNNVILPPDFNGLEGYDSREIYANVPEPDRNELALFHNRYLGQRCFIIGNGPSLNKHDLSLLENEYAFGVNSFYYKTRDTGYRPNFYVVEDSSVMKENIDEIRAYDPPFKFFPTIYKRLHPKTPNTFFFEMNRGFYEKTSPNYAVPRFSTDASKVLYCGQSVTYINLQLAYFMGFTEVYLIGMDFDYLIPDSHKRTGDVLLSDTDDPNHFHKDYFGAGKTWKDPKLDRVLMNYQMANLVFSSVGRKIYNATVGGKLEVFDRVDFETLLRDPVTGKVRVESINPEQIAVPKQGMAPTGPHVARSTSIADTEAHESVLRKEAFLVVPEPAETLARLASPAEMWHWNGSNWRKSEAAAANLVYLRAPHVYLAAAADDRTSSSHVIEGWCAAVDGVLARVQAAPEACSVVTIGASLPAGTTFPAAFAGRMGPNIPDRLPDVTVWDIPVPALQLAAAIVDRAPQISQRLELLAAVAIAQPGSHLDAPGDDAVRQVLSLARDSRKLATMEKTELPQLKQARENDAGTIKLLYAQIAQLKATLEDFDRQGETDRKAMQLQNDKRVAAHRAGVASLEKELDKMRQQKSSREHEIADILRSHSWRLTRPLRVVTRAVRRSPSLPKSDPKR